MKSRSLRESVEKRPLQADIRARIKSGQKKKPLRKSANTFTCTFTLTEELDHAIETIALHHNQSRSAVVRQAVLLYAARFKKDS